MEKTRNPRIKPKGVFPCPICEQTEHLTMTAKWFFEELMEENGQAMVYLECEECKLELNNYNKENKSYEKTVSELKEKWNTRAEVASEREG